MSNTIPGIIDSYEGVRLIYNGGTYRLTQGAIDRILSNTDGECLCHIAPPCSKCTDSLTLPICLDDPENTELWEPTLDVFVL